VLKAFEFDDRFFKPARLALSVLQKWLTFAAGFSKENCSLETCLVVVKTSKIGSSHFSKARSAVPRNLLFS
jgi:hypothetical protein